MDGYRLPELKPKIYGKYRGIVVVGKDPEGKGRVKVQVPALFGFKTIENWAYPVLPPQFVGIDIGGGKLQLDWETIQASNVTVNSISQVGADYIPSTINASSLATQGGTSTRQKLPKLIGVDPSSWEIPAGTGVWVEFEGGDPDKPLWCGFWR
ncbi:hypothetical protein [Thermoanaerobacterium sp. DL9XJH110]|uniref:hypothetical protein n=1 Tax=Thermoanaerobacterium sp. DL9XJH110 TaxID=3386643 RepID=UPI003BB52955